MNLLALIIVFSVIGGLISLAGAFVLLKVHYRLTERILIHLVTFSAGVLLGASFLDILPEAFAEIGNNSPNLVFSLILAGILVFFIIERILIGFHRHEDDDSVKNKQAPQLLLLGDALHNFLDGVAIALAFIVSVPLGVITGIAVAAHEIPAEMGEFTVQLRAGWKKRTVLFANVFVSLMSVIGALVTYFIRNEIEPWIPLLLAFAAGGLIYIASSDLIPEVNLKTRRDNAWHVIALLVIGVFSTRIIEQLIERLLPIG